MNDVFVRMSERRAMRRYARVPCQVVRERDFTLVGTMTLDVSTGGMLVESDAKVLTGEDLLVSFYAPALRTWFDAEATVARVVHGRRDHDAGRAIGVSFRKIDQVTRTYWSVSLRGLPPPIPARGPRVDYARTVRSIAARV